MSLNHSVNSHIADIALKLRSCYHLLCFVLPLSTFFFLTTRPDTIIGSLAWTLPFWLMLLVDWLNINFDAGTDDALFPEQVFDGILYVLIFLQIANIYLMLQYVSKLNWSTSGEIIANIVNLIIVRFLVGTSSGTSGIVVAHELIHRSQPSWQLLGRILLCTVCYEHFAIAHKRCHHQNLGLTSDMTAARVGENFKNYWQRVRLGYLKYTWHSEQERLATTPKQKSLIYNEAFLGISTESLLILLIIYNFGWLAAAMFIYQALSSIRILEAVNYFQHWGLDNGKFGNTYGWVTYSSISRYVLIGLSHHIGHHQNESTHYYEIPYSKQGPRLPYGYFVMNLWVKFSNASYQKMALKELLNFQTSQFTQILR